MAAKPLYLLATKYDNLRAHVNDLVFISPALQLMKIKFRLRFPPLELPQGLWRPASRFLYYLSIYLFIYLFIYFTRTWQYQFRLCGFSSYVSGWSRG